MLDSDHAEIQVCPLRSAPAAAELGTEQVEQAAPGSTAAAITPAPGTPAGTTRGHCVEGRGDMASSAGTVILNRAALVMHVTAMALATGRLLRTVHGPLRHLMTISTIAGLGLSGIMVRIVAVAGRTGCRGTSALVANGAVARDAQQGLTMVYFRNSCGMAILTTVSRGHNCAMAGRAIAAYRRGLPMVIRAAVTSRATNVDRLSAGVTEDTLAQFKEIGRMMALTGHRRARFEMTGRTLKPAHVGTNMAGSTIPHLGRDGHVVQIVDGGLTAAGVTTLTIQKGIVGTDVTHRALALQRQIEGMVAIPHTAVA